MGKCAKPSSLAKTSTPSSKLPLRRQNLAQHLPTVANTVAPIIATQLLSAISTGARPDLCRHRCISLRHPRTTHFSASTHQFHPLLGRHTSSHQNGPKTRILTSTSAKSFVKHAARLEHSVCPDIPQNILQTNLCCGFSKERFFASQVLENSPERFLNHLGVTFPLSKKIPVSCHAPTRRLLSSDRCAAFLHSFRSPAYCTVPFRCAKSKLRKAKLSQVHVPSHAEPTTRGPPWHATPTTTWDDSPSAKLVVAFLAQERCQVLATQLPHSRVAFFQVRSSLVKSGQV